MTGTVPDVRPFVDEAALYVVPLRAGGGTRLKIFEAMAMAKAVVSTTIGAEGLAVTSGREIVIADDPDDFARAVTSLLRDPDARQRLGQAGRALVELAYGWEVAVRSFESHCEAVVARARSPSSAGNATRLRRTEWSRVDMKVSVFGLGYVGCVTAACLAREGHQVIGVDVNADKVAALNAGHSPIVESGLDELVARGVQAGRLSATLSADEAVRWSDVALICVGTPDLGHGLQNLSALMDVAGAIGGACAGRTHPLTVVVRSTVLPGTTAHVFERVLSAGVTEHRAPIRFAMNPEFMREGSSVDDFEHPPLILVGSDDPMAADELRRLYAGIEAPFVHTTIRTAEMVKYASNAFHALKVCFANEIAGLCDGLGADAQEVMAIVRQDRKLNISPSYLRPGFAFGGSCLPKDLRALIHAGRVADVPIPLLGAIVTSNELHLRHGIERVLADARASGRRRRPCVQTDDR